jgi:peptide/nickel transport system ATP-binding protein
MSAIIEIKDLVVTYPTKRGPLRAVDGLNLTVEKGEVLGIVGESGCGKTTLGMSLLAIPNILHGSIRVGSVYLNDLRGEALRKFRWTKVAMVFQSAMNTLDPVRTIGSQMVETMVQHTGMTRREANERVRELLTAVSIDPSHAQSYQHQLSGGMRQRVTIAMALCLDPEVLIADEPTSGLDVIVQAGILRMLKGMQDRLRLTVIFITHDISVAAAISNRLGVMYAGKLVEIGKTTDIIENPQHPYTIALLKAVPRMGKLGEKIEGIPGYPPNLISPPSGCRFNSRCPYAFDKCRTEEPRLEIHGASEVACWLRDGQDKNDR